MYSFGLQTAASDDKGRLLGQRSRDPQPMVSMLIDALIPPWGDGCGEASWGLGLAGFPFW